MSEGRLYILSGPSGSGKDTILSEVLQRDDHLALSISSITRAMRPGEKEGEKYHFVSREDFLSMLEKEELLEHNCFCGNYYGTPKKPVLEHLKNGDDVILEIDVNGAQTVRQKMPEAVSIFVMPPSYHELCRRLRGRKTDDEAVIQKRLKSALDEIARATEYDYIVVNDKLDLAIEDVLHIIKADRLKIGRQKSLIHEVLENVET